MTDADNADELALLANTPVQTELLLYSLKQQQEALASTWTQIKQFMCFKQKRSIYTLSGKPL